MYKYTKKKAYLGNWKIDLPNLLQQVNINGDYIKDQQYHYGNGLVWSGFRGDYYTLKSTQMKFRPDYI